MGVSSIWTVFCDGKSKGCAWWTAQEIVKKDAVAIAKEEGWRRVKRNDRIVWLCPKCLPAPEKGESDGS